jgi:predicted nucleotidyltransferase
LQQYTKGFIQRGYGINLGKLALISDDEKRGLYEELKILPGHTVKLDKIIDTLAKSSYCRPSSEEEPHSVEISVKEPDRNRLKVLAKKDIDYEKQLERVLN